MGLEDVVPLINLYKAYATSSVTFLPNDANYLFKIYAFAYDATFLSWGLCV